MSPANHAAKTMDNVIHAKHSLVHTQNILCVGLGTRLKTEARHSVHTTSQLKQAMVRQYLQLSATHVTLNESDASESIT